MSADPLENQTNSTFLPVIRGRAERLISGAGGVAQAAAAIPLATVRVPVALAPITTLLTREDPVTPDELSHELDVLFDSLYAHPLTTQTRKLTNYLRQQSLLPNERTTEGLIQYVIKQSVARSPVPVPQEIVDEFWTFFNELMDAPELRGLGDLNLDIMRLILKTYEPLLVEVMNSLKDLVRMNQVRLEEIISRVQVVRGDLAILRRQIKALRYLQPFFQTDPTDYSTQAAIVAQMVREFGPFFVKMAQVAAANADFLPEKISQELLVFQEDVPPMTAEEALEALEQSYGDDAQMRYLGFNPDVPLKSGSIGSVYLAKKAFEVEGKEALVPVVVKIGRHNLDREFLLSKTSISLMILTSQYWAPHTKLTPFLEAMTTQIDEFVEGFRKELNFEEEADIQKRFASRSRKSRVWSVPDVYSSTERVIEMEFVGNAVNVSQAVAKFRPLRPSAYRRKVAENFLHTILHHVLIYQEIHGDLHPGNVMVDEDAQIYLIDWGNTVHLRGKVGPMWSYIAGAMTGDIDGLTDSLINMSTDIEGNRARREEIKANLKRTMDKKDIIPLGSTFAWQLYKEGPEGWLARLNLTAQLMSNSQQMGLVVRSEYLHLSRSSLALAGTFMALYGDMPKTVIAYDIWKTCNQFIPRLLFDRADAEIDSAGQGLWQTIKRLFD